MWPLYEVEVPLGRPQKLDVHILQATAQSGGTLYHQSASICGVGDTIEAILSSHPNGETTS